MDTLVHPHFLPPTSGLLVDQENFSITPQLEELIDDRAKFPLVTKVAFGNFMNSGKRSLVLHQHGYSMIHVPQVTNAADAQMIVTGCLLFINNPQVREVFICSNDNIFSFLKNTLGHLGKKAYLVKRKGNNLYINNILKLSQLKPEPPPFKEIKTLAELDEAIINLVGEILVEKNASAIKASLLGSRFSQLYGKGVTPLLTEFKVGIKFMGFLKLNPRLGIIQENSEYYVCLACVAQDEK